MVWKNRNHDFFLLPSPSDYAKEPQSKGRLGRMKNWKRPSCKTIRTEWQSQKGEKAPFQRLELKKEERHHAPLAIAKIRKNRGNCKLVEKKHDFSKDSNKSECIPLCFVGTIIEGSKQNSNREILFHSHKPYTIKNPNVSQRSEISFHFPRKNLWGKCTINLSFYFSKNCHKGRGFFFFGWGKFSFFGWKFCGNLRIYTILHYYE